MSIEPIELMNYIHPSGLTASDLLGELLDYGYQRHRALDGKTYALTLRYPYLYIDNVLVPPEDIKERLDYILQGAGGYKDYQVQVNYYSNTEYDGRYPVYKQRVVLINLPFDTEDMTCGQDDYIEELLKAEIDDLGELTDWTIVSFEEMEEE